ncbi:MAG: endonuclease Q family protein [Candidatus Uhrbacteria bacterium]|nr:endonuclease Q family protein [Candidatus Uhrbacteria bacterium]
MRVITDFHLHSKWSRACSKELTIKNIAKMCERKGIQFVGTSDFTHPAWREEIGKELEEAGGGSFRLKNEESPTHFLLSSEISCIYKRHGKVRRVHHLILLPTLAAVDRFSVALNQRGCNLKSDGRPIIGLDSEELLKFVLAADPQGLLIPAHAWTPWFAIFGSMSGFDSLEECFGEMTKHVTAIETGLSSDPKMNWRLSQLDKVFLVSNSDAHSLDKLGREANVFDMEKPSYDELRRILVEHDQTKFLETIEFFPEEGKYHVDGHRACKFWCEPAQTKKLKGICPKCGKPLTVGVLHRVDAIADRAVDASPSGVIPFRSIVPLAELVGDVLGVGPASKKVRIEVDKLLRESRSEFAILLDIPESELARFTSPEIVEAIRKMRAGQVSIRPGYDGEFGVVSIMGAAAERLKKQQTKLFLS